MKLNRTEANAAIQKLFQKKIDGEVIIKHIVSDRYI